MKDMDVFGTYEQRLKRVSDYIAVHLDDALDYAKLAEIACLSPWHWHRIYRAVYGETIHATVKRLRLHRAAGELVNSAAGIESIARRSGYSGVASFTRSFKSAYGMAPAGLFRPDMQMVGIYYSDPGLVAEEELQSFAGLVVPAGFTPPAGLTLREIAGGRYAVLRHKGPYAELHKAYGWFYGSYLPANGYEPADAPPVEVYLNNPREVAPQDLLTEICIPIKG
ncbi:AraC family transcriptional regulator [Martelella mediterranea]|uniref:AraC family transcriptional regulator n=1 Tax=Martelella mediterranea TaxID=293089 RepID=UPI001E50DDED|nr:AraC family transcriptional regulator [Martelella mediterranea]MCD1632221.1 AraC family transcriptional regulator [Martelella mediterranea]